MTIQVGMLASDGMVLAGDKKAHTAPERGVRHSYMRSKIEISPSGRLAVSCAMDLTGADAVAGKIIESETELIGLGQQDRESRIKEIGARAAGYYNVQSIVAFTDPEPSLYFFECSKRNDLLSCQRREEPFYSGDISNPAIFLTERYYALLPIDPIKRLAAHVIILSRRFNGGIIDGLEIALCEGTGFRFLADSEIVRLESSVKEWDKSIGDLIMGEI
jgi:hypothetical protein